MDPTKLRTTVKRREYFAGIEQLGGIEGTFYTLLLVQILFVELDFHQIAFFDPNTVFTCKDAADLDTELQNFRAEFLGRFELAGLVCVVQYERMKIAITGMKNIGHREPEFFRQL